MTRLLIDENLPPSLATVLCEAGHDAVHVNQVGLAHTLDRTIMARAEQEARTVVTLDRDFPSLLRDGDSAQPSVICISQRGGRALPGVERQAEALRTALPKLDAYLAAGASVTLDARGVRIDPLPLTRSGRGVSPPEMADRRPAGTRTSGRDRGGVGERPRPVADGVDLQRQRLAHPSHFGRGR